MNALATIQPMQTITQKVGEIEYSLQVAQGSDEQRKTLVFAEVSRIALMYGERADQKALATRASEIARSIDIIPIDYISECFGIAKQKNRFIEIPDLIKAYKGVILPRLAEKAREDAQDRRRLEAKLNNLVYELEQPISKAIFGDLRYLDPRYREIIKSDWYRPIVDQLVLLSKEVEQALQDGSDLTHIKAKYKKIESAIKKAS